MDGREPAGHVDVAGTAGIVREVVGDVIEAIGDELSAAATDDTSAVLLRGGRRLGVGLAGEVWSFEFDGNLPVLPETPGRLVVDERDDDAEPIAVTVLAVGEFDLVLGINEQVDVDLVRARLSVQPWFILDALRGRLTEALEGPLDTSLVAALLDLTEPAPPPGLPSIALPALRLQLGDDQARAAVRAARTGLQFVWGPPGTGKTSTLAGTAGLLALDAAARSDGTGVVVTAHANAAVDVAIARVAEAMAGTDEVAEGRILRVGRPHLDVARRHPEVLLDEVIARTHPALVQQLRELEAERKRLSRRLKEAAGARERLVLLARLDTVRTASTTRESQLREARDQLIEGATLIACTLSKLVLDERLWRRGGDAVIVDEASMSGLPFLVALALQAPATLACFGDFRQLPPIAVSTTELGRRWFGTDVFELAGVVDRVDARVDDPRLSVLRTQYRMGRDIASVVSDFAYSGLLRSADDAVIRAEGIASRPPVEGASIVVVDTSDLGTACLREADRQSYSRCNLLQGAVTASIAQDARTNGHDTVGVVTPYRAQARYLAGLLHGDPVTVATTHRFQGSERDVMVLDLVDAAPQAGPSRLTGGDRELSLRLLNVAASRAKGKIFVVVDVDFIHEHHPFATPARRLLELCSDIGPPRLCARDLIDLLTSGPAIRWTEGWDRAGAELVRHLCHEPTTLDISLSDRAPWLKRLVDALPARGYDVVVRAPLPVALELEHSGAQLHLRQVGPAPLAFVGATQIMVGSCDPLGPVAHIEGMAAASAARRLLLE